jgi:hypothetical protein
MIADLPEGVMLRDFAPGDTAYIFSTWLRDLRDFDPGPLPDDLFFAVQPSAARSQPPPTRPGKSWVTPRPFRRS